MKKFLTVIFAAILLVGCANKEKQIGEQWVYCVISIQGSKTPQVYSSGEKAQLVKASDYQPLNFPNDIDIERVLNGYGKDGWELVDVYTNIETVFPNMGNEQYHTGIKENTRTQIVNYVFKKRKL